MSASSPTPLFAKNSIEMQLAKGAIILGAITIIGAILGVISKASGTEDTFSITVLGVALLASVANFYVIVTLVAILYTKEKGNNVS